MTATTPALLAAAHAFSLPWAPGVAPAVSAIALSVAKALAIVILAYFASGLVAARFGRVFDRGGIPRNVAILFTRLTWAGVWVLAFIWIFYAVGTDLSPLAALIGVIGLALSLSVQAVLQNLVAGVYLLIERPFAIGDTIFVVGPNGANHEGSVEDIQMRTTHLRSKTNELILMPNSSIFLGVVTNRTAVGGYATTMQVTFPRASDPDSVRTTLFPLLQALPSVLEEPGPVLRVESLAVDTWTASVSFWVASHGALSDAAWAIGSQFPAATLTTGMPP